jgi:hypothetical protein
MTIYEALKLKLNREPTYEELKLEVQRIIREGNELCRSQSKTGSATRR